MSKMTVKKLILKFKEHPHLGTRLKVSEIVAKYSLAIEQTFETPGRPDPTVNIVLAVEPGDLENTMLALKRLPEVLVTEKH